MTPERKDALTEIEVRRFISKTAFVFGLALGFIIGFILSAQVMP